MSRLRSFAHEIVVVNGEVESRIRKKMRSGDTASFENDECKVEYSVRVGR